MMQPRNQPKTASEMQRMRKGRNFVLLGIIAGLAALFYVLTLVKIGGRHDCGPCDAYAVFW